MKINFKELVQKIKKVKRIRLKIIIFAVALIILGCVISATVYISDNRYISNINKTIQTEEKYRINFEVPEGAGTSYVAELLQKKGIIGNKDLFIIIAKLTGYDGKFISGYHVVSEKLSYNEIMTVLSQKPSYSPQSMVTIPENFSYSETVAKLVKEKIIDQKKFEEASNTGTFDYKFIKDVPKRTHRLEGYLFPETYSFEGDLTEKQVINIFLKQFDKIFVDKYYKRAKELNMTVDQIITLASIVEKEAKRSDERAMIAGVFYNRLHTDIEYLKKLQSCATVQYILMESGQGFKETITNKDTEIDNPYNTYKYAGLPPGPICSPGEDSIIAALYPEETDNMYFVAKDDGTGGHYFSKTYQEHLNNISKASKNNGEIK